MPSTVRHRGNANQDDDLPLRTHRNGSNGRLTGIGVAEGGGNCGPVCVAGVAHSATSAWQTGLAVSRDFIQEG